MVEEKFGIKTKTRMLEELNAKFDSNPNFAITHYKGISATAIERLRRKLDASSSRYFVVKNSMARRVFEKLGKSELNEFLKGEVGIGFFGDIISASKTLAEFSKENPSFRISSAVIDGKVEKGERIKELASLPSRGVLLALLLCYMKSPITGFVAVLGSVSRKFVYAVREIKEKKERGEKK